MDELKIVDFYDNLSRETKRSRNELIAMALEFAMDKIKVESLPENQEKPAEM